MIEEISVILAHEVPVLILIFVTSTSKPLPCVPLFGAQREKCLREKRMRTVGWKGFLHKASLLFFDAGP